MSLYIQADVYRRALNECAKRQPCKRCEAIHDRWGGAKGCQHLWNAQAAPNPSRACPWPVQAILPELMRMRTAPSFAFSASPPKRSPSSNHFSWRSASATRIHSNQL